MGAGVGLAGDLRFQEFMTGILVMCCEYIDEFPAFSWDAWSDCTCKGRN